jgi:hypothetical protein
MKGIYILRHRGRCNRKKRVKLESGCQRTRLMRTSVVLYWELYRIRSRLVLVVGMSKQDREFLGIPWNEGMRNVLG